MPLPAEILAAATDPMGGRWVLVIGAGCSVEAPTLLPTGAESAQEAHRRLRADGILAEDCPNPADLSAVADAVFAMTHGQGEMVLRLPKNRFRLATPNSGHLIAAVLLVEGSLAGVVTLNFDLAMSNALAAIGAADAVAVVTGPDDIQHLAAVNLVYLHRNADAPAEEWVLRSAYLNAVWNGRWEPVIATRILLAPVVVFAGLGSPAAALTETISLIRRALPAHTVHVYQVDPAPFGTLPFTAALNVAAPEYREVGWCDFMQEVADRVLSEHWLRFAQACRALETERGLPVQDLARIADASRRLGLVGFGVARARWLMHDGPYARVGLVNPQLIADLLLTVSFVAAGLGGAVTLREDGAAEVREGDRVIAVMGLATGGGVRTLVAVEAAIAAHRKYWPWKDTPPRKIVVTGHLPSAIAPTPPISIVAEVDEDDIISAQTSPQVLSAYELLTSANVLAGLAG